MLYYHRIDVLEYIDIDEINESHKFHIFHYNYFLKMNFCFLSRVCNGCQDLLQKGMIFKDVAIVSVKVNIYRIHFRVWVKIKM